VLGGETKPAELRELILAEREGQPFLFLRDGSGALQTVALGADRVLLGRSPQSDIEVSWDPRVSAVHASLERRGARWVIDDDGLSRNGTFIAGERVRGQRTLHDGDVIQVGDTLLGFRDPASDQVLATVTMVSLAPPEVSPAQRRILLALCRPLADTSRSTPATNEEIARELTLTVAAVKSHLRVLFDRFELDQLPQNEKRARLAERAIATGVVRFSELRRSSPAGA
jgi:pSer/pThr/pTyr-binding forkhead associated (FHA) protein